MALPGLVSASILAVHVPVSSIAALAAVLASAPAELPIRWDGPPACVDAAGLGTRIHALVGPTTPRPAAALVLGAEPWAGGWRVTLVLEPPGAAEALRRTLEGRDCATLTEAVALVVAVHLDAVAVAGVLMAEPLVEPPAPARPVEPAKAEPGPSAQERTTPASAPVTLAAPRSSRPRPRALASVAVAGELGVLPRGAAAFELAGGVGWSRARLELGGVASVGPGVASERLPTVGGRFGLLTGVVRGCGVAWRSRVALPLCGGLELGDLRATGTGLQRPATVNALWVAAVASARPQWAPWPRLAVGALLDLVVPLRRHRFATPEAGLVHAVDPVAVRLGLRVELRLP